MYSNSRVEGRKKSGKIKTKEITVDRKTIRNRWKFHGIIYNKLEKKSIQQLDKTKERRIEKTRYGKQKRKKDRREMKKTMVNLRVFVIILHFKISWCYFCLTHS